MFKGYFLQMYGKRSPDFVKGVIAGIEAFSTWKDGQEVVGIEERPIREVIEEIKQELLENPEEFPEETWRY